MDMKKRKNEIDMCNGPLFGKVLIFSLPLMLSGILQLLYNAADVAAVSFPFIGSSAPGIYTGAHAYGNRYTYLALFLRSAKYSKSRWRCKIHNGDLHDLYVRNENRFQLYSCSGIWTWCHWRMDLHDHGLDIPKPVLLLPLQKREMAPRYSCIHIKKPPNRSEALFSYAARSLSSQITPRSNASVRPDFMSCFAIRSEEGREESVFIT